MTHSTSPVLFFEKTIQCTKGSGGESTKMMLGGILLMCLLTGAMVMINLLEIDDQSMDHMVEDKVEQQQLMALSPVGSSDVAKKQKQQEMNATPNKKKNLCKRSDIRHGKWVGKINSKNPSTETAVMPMLLLALIVAKTMIHAMHLIYTNGKLPRKKTKMTALANSNKNSIRSYFVI